MNKIATALSGKSRLIALIIFTLMIILATWLLKLFLNEIRAISDVSEMDPETAVIKLKTLINILSYVMIVIGIGLGVYILRFALKVRSSGQYPPLGTVMLRKVEIVYGSAAKSKQNLLYVTAVISASSGFLFTFILNLLINKI